MASRQGERLIGRRCVRPGRTSGTADLRTQAADRIVSIQALRFLAAAVVVYHHACELAVSIGRGAALAPARFPDLGAAGVDVLFIISGFVITLTGPLARPRPTALRFFWRRWSRVAPLFYVISVPTVLALSMPLRTDKTIATLFFWPAAGPAITARYVGLGWTLCFEMVFYTAVALALAGGRLERNLILVAAAAAVLIVLRRLDAWIGLRFLVNPIFLEFGAGVLLALGRARLKRLAPGFGLAVAGLGLAMFACEGVHGMGDAHFMEPTLEGWHALFRVIVFGLPAALTVTGALIAEPLFRGPVARALAWLGDASYSTYLVHGVVMAMLYRILARAGPPVDLVAAAGLTLGLSAGVGCYLAVERPLQRFVRGCPAALSTARARLAAAAS